MHLVYQADANEKACVYQDRSKREKNAKRCPMINDKITLTHDREFSFPNAGDGGVGTSELPLEQPILGQCQSITGCLA